MLSVADVRHGRNVGGRPIAWPIFALVVAAVVLISVVAFAVTFRGPPRDGLRGPERIAQALKTGAPQPGPGPKEIVQKLSEPPVPDSGLMADPAAVRELALVMGVPPARLIGYTERKYGPGGDPFFGAYLYGWQTKNGWQVVRAPRPPLLMPWHRVTLASMLIAISVLALAGWAIARAISRPLEQLAAVAGRARPGAPLGSLPDAGSREVRELSLAVSQMHSRLSGHARGRTTMLAAIAHDLGTPLSRLAFRIEQLPEAVRVRAISDIEEMRAMIATALHFARDELADDVHARVDLGSLLDSLAEDMHDAGADIAVTPGTRAIVRGDPAALRRLFSNLLDNAVRYGERARITWNSIEGEVEITIDDDGPGIDPAQAHGLFEPFVRGEASRNRATGGTGLGLAIVRSIAERHGGTAVLENGERGARARITLPLSSRPTGTATS